MSALSSAWPGLSLILGRAGGGYRQNVRSSQRRINTSKKPSRIMIIAGNGRAVSQPALEQTARE